MSRYISIILIVDIVDRFHREKKTTKGKKEVEKKPFATCAYLLIAQSTSSNTNIPEKD